MVSRRGEAQKEAVRMSAEGSRRSREGGVAAGLGLPQIYFCKNGVGVGEVGEFTVHSMHPSPGEICTREPLRDGDELNLKGCAKVDQMQNIQKGVPERGSKSGSSEQPEWLCPGRRRGARGCRGPEPGDQRPGRPVS